ncbi:class I SAM-dependent methyltransferase [Adhaeribacter radiodurans]|uniref:Class I SAM-dependent methyltransferase n=1 Tax=Adhaeribacter radiodurans TaxID=2745197 RepID=A0A7L7L898_9BACT|nr:class I SAM-dependent methyltransferase [Adhaeribacter radiodurans]QMU28964.1 class I SAM-dependent methyltransferase [Adhaeribacter radiodurans]
MPVELKRPCPVCQSQTGNFLYHQDFILFDGHPLSQGYDLVYCDNCYFTFADTTVTQADYDEYYTNLSRYQDNKTSTGGGENALDAKRLDDTVADIVKKLTSKNARILDIGCANGGLLKRFKDLGYTNLVGIDPSPVCAENTKKLTGLEAHAASLFHIPAHLGTFDVIIVSHVLEHLFDLYQAIEGFYAILNEGGIVYAECPDAGNYYKVIHAPFQEINTEHINHFSTTSFFNLFSIHNFTKLADGKRSFLIPSGLPYTAVYGFYQKSAENTSNEITKDYATVEAIQSYIQKSSLILTRINEKIEELNSRQKEIFVWGTGQLTMKLLANTALRNANIKAFIDSSPVNAGRHLNNRPILHPTKVADFISKDDVILITSTIYEEAIQNDISTIYKFQNQVEGLKRFIA